MQQSGDNRELLREGYTLMSGHAPWVLPNPLPPRTDGKPSTIVSSLITSELLTAKFSSASCGGSFFLAGLRSQVENFLERVFCVFRRSKLDILSFKVL